VLDGANLTFFCKNPECGHGRKADQHRSTLYGPKNKKRGREGIGQSCGRGKHGGLQHLRRTDLLSRFGSKGSRVEQMREGLAALFQFLLHDTGGAHGVCVQ